MSIKLSDLIKDAYISAFTNECDVKFELPESPFPEPAYSAKYKRYKDSGIYNNDGESLVIYDKFNNGLRCVIVSNGGRWPCSYINVEPIKEDLIKREPNFTDEEDEPQLDYIVDCLIDVHGGVTFHREKMPGGYGSVSDIKGDWIGWDYAHAGDWCNTGLVFGDDQLEHKYTLGELIHDVETAANDLIRMVSQK